MCFRSSRFYDWEWTVFPLGTEGTLLCRRLPDSCANCKVGIPASLLTFDTYQPDSHYIGTSDGHSSSPCIGPGHNFELPNPFFVDACFRVSVLALGIRLDAWSVGKWPWQPKLETVDT